MTNTRSLTGRGADSDGVSRGGGVVRPRGPHGRRAGRRCPTVACAAKPGGAVGASLLAGDPGAARVHLSARRT
jgi:hypothetical protein